MDIEPIIKGFFDPTTNTISYVVQDPASQSCVVIDSVMDFDYAAGRVSFANADIIIHYIQAHQLQLEWLIETHIHADHLSAAPYIQQQLGGQIMVGRNICMIQDVFGKTFNEGTDFERDGSQFDRLLDDGDTYQIGSMTAFDYDSF